jgi:hypothetical protein
MSQPIVGSVKQARWWFVLLLENYAKNWQWDLNFEKSPVAGLGNYK